MLLDIFNRFVWFTSLQKSIIFAFALIAAVSCDVSEIVQGDGWFKDETGYHYDVPQNKFFEDVPAAPEVVVADPLTVVDEPVYDPEEAAPGVSLKQFFLWIFIILCIKLLLLLKKVSKWRIRSILLY